MLHVNMMRLKFCDGQGDSRSRMYDARTVHLWSWSLILMHACRYDACIYDAAELLSPTDEPTDKAILGVGLKADESLILPLVFTTSASLTFSKHWWLFLGPPKKWNDVKDHVILCSHIFQHLLSRKMFKNTSFTHRGQSNPGTALRYGIQTYPFSTLGGGDRRRHRNEGIFALLIFWSLAFHILIQQAVTVFTQFTTFHTCVVYQKKYPALFDRSGICKV